MRSGDSAARCQQQPLLPGPLDHLLSGLAVLQPRLLSAVCQPLRRRMSSSALLGRGNRERAQGAALQRPRAATEVDARCSPDGEAGRAWPAEQSEQGPRRRDERWAECERCSAERAKKRRAAPGGGWHGGQRGGARPRPAGDGRRLAGGTPQPALGGRMRGRGAAATGAMVTYQSGHDGHGGGTGRAAGACP
ncbi:hypothetical protein PVAP13_8NG231200 [Panicum virgatum]|uniref:Uncharacterized protein n=1 Tax=Panicum virgatum TaxID=38727 RepID=A0A8T0P9R8_PANVG|nr:hypothetical protein PVAP13_8NG231200 [Panicum virgatum]